MKYQTFIPLGPSCAATGILKWTNLRRFSYPLDWTRSGSAHLEDLFRLKPDEYFFKHISTPNIQLVSDAPPSVQNNSTSSLSINLPVYGYNYFFNPHKVPSALKRHSQRCLERFASVTSRTDVYLNFLMAVDGNLRTNEESLDNFELIATFLFNVISRYVSCERFNITLCSCFTKNIPLVEINKLDIFDQARYVKLYLPTLFTGPASGEYRDFITGKLLYSRETISRYPILQSV